MMMHKPRNPSAPRSDMPQAKEETLETIMMAKIIDEEVDEQVTDERTFKLNWMM
jgi:hypothetical protein